MHRKLYTHTHVHTRVSARERVCACVVVHGGERITRCTPMVVYAHVVVRRVSNNVM